MTQQIRHNLRTRLKPRHRWSLAADDLVDQIEIRFVAGDIAQSGADKPGGVRGMAACAVDLENNVALDGVTGFSKDAADIGVVEAGGLDGKAGDRDDDQDHQKADRDLPD